jgi:hypothetical protein
MCRPECWRGAAPRQQLLPGRHLLKQSACHLAGCKHFTAMSGINMHWFNSAMAPSIKQLVSTHTYFKAPLNNIN